MPITAIFAAALAVLLLILSVRVIGVRRAARVEIGEGSDRELLRRVRVHANFVEYTPYVLILMGLAESMRATPIALIVVGLLLLVGRVIHAYGLSQTPHIMVLRVAGMAMTFTALASGAVLCAVYSVMRFSAT